MVVNVAEDEIHIFLIAQHNIAEEFQAELGEFNRPVSHGFDLFALFFRDALGKTARDGGAWVDFSPSDHLDHRVSILARLNDLAANLESDLVDYTEDVAFCNRRIGTHDEIGAA